MEVERRARDAYLETQIDTASPPKLRLMLIEGALGKASQTLSCWEAGREEEALAALQKCQNIVAELAASIRDDGTKLIRAVLGVHLFMLQTLLEAQRSRDPRKIEDLIRVLEQERETWRAVCSQLSEAPDPGSPDSTPKEITAAGMAPIPPLRLAPETAPDAPGPTPLAESPSGQGFSLEA